MPGDKMLFILRDALRLVPARIYRRSTPMHNCPKSLTKRIRRVNLALGPSWRSGGRFLLFAGLVLAELFWRAVLQSHGEGPLDERPSARNPRNGCGRFALLSIDDGGLEHARIQSYRKSDFSASWREVLLQPT